MTSGRTAGLRGSAPLLLPTAAIGLTFGLLAAQVFGAIPALVMSALVWSGTAQFAALSVVSGGGNVGLAAVTGLLANTRFLPMGFGIAPSLRGSRARNAATGALLADASFAIAHRDEGDFDISALVWSAPLQYVGWVGGTALGVAGASIAADPGRLGLDVLFPVFYLSLLLPELRGSSRAVLAAVISAAITFALTPIAPHGVPVLAASAAALIGLVRPRNKTTEAS
jgi:predicted branched-subunit amino acid permease